MGFLAPLGAAAVSALGSVGTALGSAAGAAGSAIGGAASSVGGFLGGEAGAIGGLFGGGASGAGGVAGAASSAASGSMLAGEVSTGLNIGGSLFSGFGAFQQGMFNASIARNNEKIANINAQAALTSGQAAEETQKIRTGKLVGSIESAQAAGGIDVNSQTPTAARDSAANIGALDALTIRYNAAMNAYNYKREAAAFSAQSKADQMGAVGGLASGLFGAASSFLGGASSLSSKWKLLQASGALPGWE